MTGKTFDATLELRIGEAQNEQRAAEANKRMADEQKAHRGQYPIGSTAALGVGCRDSQSQPVAVAKESGGRAGDSGAATGALTYEHRKGQFRSRYEVLKKEPEKLMAAAEELMTFAVSKGLPMLDLDCRKFWRMFPGSPELARKWPVRR